MIILFLKSQFGLFDMPVHVAGSVDKHGVVRKPHVRVQKVALKKPAAQTEPQADLFEMAAKPAPRHEPEVLDLFSQLEPVADAPSVVAEQAETAPAKPASEEPAPAPQPSAEPPRQEVKWFGSSEKAEAYLDKKKLRGTHEVVPVGRRFEIHERVVAGPEAATPAASQLATVTPFGVTAGTSKAERIKLNAAALKIIREKNPEDMTAADRRTLASYSGNGGTGDSLNEFYTDVRVAAGMWDSLRALGMPENATALEPSCATGVFMHTAPAGVRVTGVELDNNSADIASVLHGDRHEIRNASLERFATSDDRQFDVVIGNPPFGLRGSMIKDDKPDLSTAEQYFIDTALDKCKPGGLVALIVPTGVMDAKSNRSFRERMQRKGVFLGAVRMPNTAFEHAHTGVTTDVIYLRKRPDDVAGALMTVPQDTLRALGVWDEDMLSGSYFTDGAGREHVLGTMTEGWRAKAGMGQDITVEGSMHGVPEAIAEFRPELKDVSRPTVQDVLASLTDEKARSRAEGGAKSSNYGKFKVGDTKVEGGVTYILQGNPPRWHRVESIMEMPEVADAVSIAGDLDNLMSGQAVDRQALEAAVRAYVEKHGNPNKSEHLRSAATQNRTLYRLLGAVKPDGTLSDAVTGATRKVENTFDSAAESLAAERGAFTPEQLAERWGKGDSEDALDHLYASGHFAMLDDGQWTTMDEYLSGYLWDKADALRAKLAGDGLAAVDRKKLDAQLAALDDAIGAKALEDVDIELNSGWVPPHIVAEFFTQQNASSESKWARELPPVKITYDGGVYAVSGGNEWSQTKLLDKYLNRTGVKKDDWPTIKQWNADFKEWLCASEFREQVEDLYNRKFMGWRDKKYSDEPFDIPGMVTDGLKRYQYPGLRWALDRGKGIIAADVGLGKTARGLMLARMAKVTGKAKVPTIVVPKSVMANWFAEANKWFPGSRVLTIGETYTMGEDGAVKGKEDSAAERKRKWHDLTQNDYDFVLISQPAFNEVDMSPAVKNNYLADDFWVQRGDKLGNAGDKRIKRVREAFEQSVASREFDKRTDAIYFDDLGVDMLIMDEMHGYKNLYAARNRFGESPKFLGGQGQSNRAFDFQFKARWIREHNNGGNVYGLTATPTKNSPLEIYSMLSYVAPEEFEKIGIRNSEDFLDRFCKFENDNILSTGGDIEEALIVSGFKNMDELRDIMRKYIDRTTAADVGLKLPERDDRMHLVEMDAAQHKEYEYLREQLAEASKKDATGDAHIFAIMDKMSKAAMDLELLDASKYEGHSSPKYAAAAEQIAEGAKDGGQVVFADFVGAHEKIAAELEKLGIKRSQIGIINAKAAASSSKRQKIADDFNSGKLKVVIGNTATMGEGLNLQKATTDIHHLDLPWEPASIQQRNGRGLRQGNINESIRIHTYLSRGSFDGYKYQTVSAKKDWQDLLWTGGNEVENYSRSAAPGREDMLVMMAANPDEARKALEENKALAKERYKQGRVDKANGEFLRFRSMSRSYKSLKNKSSMSAVKLKTQLDRARAALNADKYFKAKELLSSDVDAVLLPTGDVLKAGSLVKPGEGSKYAGGPLVVSGVVDEKTGTIRVREYGRTGGGHIISASDLGRNPEVSSHDEAAEAAEIRAKMEADAKAGIQGGIKSYADLKNMPSSLVSELQDDIQRQLKEGAKAYSVVFPHKVGMLNRGTGAVESFSSYEHGRNAETHDYLMPTEDHKEKAVQSWMDYERRKSIGTESQTVKRGRTIERTVFKYPGAWGQHENPAHEASTPIFGDAVQEEGRRRLQAEIMPKVRSAASFADAFKAVQSLSYKDLSGNFYLPKRALATLYAKAKKEGVLDSNPESVLPGRTKGERVLLPATGGSLFADMLISVQKAGHYDLIGVMVADKYKDAPAKALAELADSGAVVSNHSNYANGFYTQVKQDVTYPRVILEAMKHIIDKNPELADDDPWAAQRDGHKWRVYGYMNSVFGGSKPVGQAVRDALEGK